MLHIGALGTDFKKASMDMRDKQFLEKERWHDFLEAIPPDAPVSEVVALSTCNRIEIFYVCTEHAEAALWLTEFLARFHNIPVSQLSRALTNYRCADAVRHLFRVASGVESMVFGEHEILGQIRNAYFQCFKKEKTDSYLNRLFQQAIATGKEVRSKTAAGRGALSIASIAVEYMEENYGELAGASVLVVGIGTMGLRALKRLSILKTARLGLCNRTDERAERFCTTFRCELVRFADLAASTEHYDIVLLATAAHGYILSADTMRPLVEKRTTPLLIVDLGAPRNADPAIAALDNVSLVCIDQLRATAEKRLTERKNELLDIETIIEQQVCEFTRWYSYKSECACNNQ